jgi:hypothetical protein
MTSEWQSIETAPKDGTIFLAYWGCDPQFVAWVNMLPTVETRKVGPFWRRRVVVERRENAGFRVLMPSRGGGFGVHGNYAPFTPREWMPIPSASNNPETER